MRRMPAARWSGASATNGTVVVQLGEDTIPRGMSRTSSGFTSAITSGTSGSMRNAADLSTTRAPLSTACGAHSSASGSSTSMTTRSRPSKQPSASTWHTTSPSLNGSARPSERGDAYARSSSTGKARWSRRRSISVPTRPVAPTTPTLMAGAPRARTRRGAPARPARRRSRGRRRRCGWSTWRSSRC